MVLSQQQCGTSSDHQNVMQPYILQVLWFNSSSLGMGSSRVIIMYVIAMVLLLFLVCCCCFLLLGFILVVGDPAIPL